MWALLHICLEENMWGQCEEVIHQGVTSSQMCDGCCRRDLWEIKHGTRKTMRQDFPLYMKHSFWGEQGLKLWHCTNREWQITHSHYLAEHRYLAHYLAEHLTRLCHLHGNKDQRVENFSYSKTPSLTVWGPLLLYDQSFLLGVTLKCMHFPLWEMRSPP